MMGQIVFVVTESLDGGFEASALDHRIHTQGETWEDLREIVQDAVQVHFDGFEKPAQIHLLKSA